jgi:mannose-6-phosphate isomerase
VLLLAGAPQHYAWGSPTAIPHAIGVEPDGRPWAELWWGTHPLGPTRVTRADGSDGLLVEACGSLPFLVKLLAADRPLSLQAHPSDRQAVEGFRREETAGVSIDAPERLYKDRRGKPEVLIALTAFDALCGFRPIDKTRAELAACGAGAVADRLGAAGVLGTVEWLLRERPDIAPDHPLFRRLSAEYPNDPGALVALLLNRVELQPGTGVFLPAGVLHMYVHGVGLEVMGASDNVLRGGLTPKHVDVPELLRTLDPRPTDPPVVRPDHEGWYPADTDAFAIQGLARRREWQADAAEILVRLDGGGGTRAWLVEPDEQVVWNGGLGCRVTRRRARIRA